MTREAPDPVALIAGPAAEPSRYRCADCRAIQTHPARLTTGGAECERCGAQVTSVDLLVVAGLRPRLFSLLVDVAFVLATGIWPLMFIGFALTFSAPRDQHEHVVHSAVVWITIVLVGLASTVLIAYLWIGNVRGRSVGKRAIGLMLTRFDTGDRPGAARGSMRTLAELATICTLGLGYAVMFFDSDRRTLYDRIAGTVVVET